MSLEAAARTHAGRVRSSNEDAWLSRPQAGLFAVVDGMGGEAAGEVAAAIAVQALAEVPDLPELASETVLSQALAAARDRILAAADADVGREGMGAVATAVRFDDRGGSISIAHVGDTRAYLVTASGVRVLTHDHLADAPAGKKRQVARDLGRRDLRGDWVETSRSRVARGDLLVLCSDGLHDVVSAEELGAELVKLRAEARTADAVATRLVSMALSAGGPDNVTVVAVRVGRFRRGAAPRSAPLPALLVVSALVGAVGGWLAAGRLAESPVALPEIVSGAVVISGSVERVVPSGSRTELTPGASLVVVGDRLRGSDWSVEAGPEASFQLERSVLSLDRELYVQLAPGSTALLRDVRVERGRIRLAVPAGASVVIEYLSLPEEAALIVEGEGVVRRADVNVRPGEAAPIPAPGEPSQP
jgi:PPM family protein phosphatase